MKKISEWIVKHRIFLFITVILITLFLGYQIRNLKVNSDVTKYFPASDPVVRLLNYIGDTYGGNSMAVISLEAEDIFSRETLAGIAGLTRKLKETDGIAYVTSLANIIDIRKTADGLEIGKLIDENNLPSAPADLEKLKTYTLSKEMYRDRIVSSSGRFTALLCLLSDSHNKTETCRTIRETVLQAGLKEKAYFSGSPFFMLDLNDIILKDLVFLTPLSIIIIITVLLISFRSFRRIVPTMVSLLFGTVWTIGLMALLKIPFAIISDVIPVILIVVGSAYGIHVVSKFDEEVTGGPDQRLLQAAGALRHVALPVTLAAVTTIAGFIAFIFGSYLTMIQEFGMLTAIGILFALLIALTFIPSLLTLFPPRKHKSAEYAARSGRTLFQRAMDTLSRFILKNNRLILAFFILVILAGILGIPRIQRKVDIQGYFLPQSSIRKSDEIISRNFGGSIMMQVLVKGDITDPGVLRAMKETQDFLKHQENVHNPQSVADLVIEMNDVMGEGKKIPDTKEKVANLWFFIEGEETLSQLVNDEKTEAVIQCMVGRIENTAQLKKMLNSIHGYLNKKNSGELSMSLTGYPSIYEHLDDSILQSQVRSLIICIILVLMCLIFLLRSLRGGLIGLVPIVFTLLLIFGCMGYFGIPLDVATVLVGSVAIGIGIDYPIHFINRFRHEHGKGGPVGDAIKRTLETTGKAILINAMTVMLGFLVLLFGNLVPIQHFAILLALTMLGSGFATMVILPSFIIVTGTYFSGNGNGKNNLSAVKTAALQ